MRRIVRRSVVLLFALALVPLAGRAQMPQMVDARFGGEEVAAAEPRDGELDEKAAFIAQYDDNEVDVYYFAPSATTYELAMLFDGVGGSDDVNLGSVQVCWRQTGADSKIRYEVVIWAANGAGGAPGTELAHYAAVATGVTATPSFHTTSVSFPLVPTDVYIGVRWNPVVDPTFQFCGDRDGIGGAVQPGYRRSNEAGAWATMTSLDATYNALMIRGFISTPGIFVENLLLPSFLIDKTDPAGATTLFAIRNLTTTPVDVDIEVFRTSGLSQVTDSIALGPRDTATVNLRDVPGLFTDIDGFARGFVVFTTAGNPDQTPVIAGDFFQVDVADDFAVGEKLVRLYQETCDDASIRYLEFPLPGSGSRIRAFVNNPRGTGAADPISFAIKIYNEAGALTTTITVKTDRHIVDVSPDKLPGTLPTFGTMVFDFGNASGGVVFGEYNVQGRFSVGLSSQCEGVP